MAKKNGKKKAEPKEKELEITHATQKIHRLHPDTKKSIWAIVLAGSSIILALAGFDLAGPAGEYLYEGFYFLVGWGYVLIPFLLVFIAGVLALSATERFLGMTLIGGAVFVLASLGLIHIFSEDNGGIFGMILGSLKIPFGVPAATILNSIVLIVSVLMILNTPLKLPFGKKDEEGEEKMADDIAALNIPEEETKKEEVKADKKTAAEPEKKDKEVELEIKEPGFFSGQGTKKATQQKIANYIAPPLNLLQSSIEKPTTGDLRANANIIKRTLESFGITVEMGEINIGPKVTRYTLKPAEGVKLSRIEALDDDLALALAAHPIRIEAPIPGKSLVGIEVPNRAAAVVRLGSLMNYPEFHSQGALAFCLGRDMMGEPIFANIDKMPHLLIAGATGSGKSVMVHDLIVSLLFKNSPAQLKFIMIDPKRVELTAYQNIPHLASPVITDVKKAIGVFRWAIAEMEKRYQIMESVGSRDIKSYNSKAGKNDPMPYIVIIVDELADIMSTQGREVEGAIVRLAQMARAVGIHLVLATQRPSVEVVTGLIKANFPCRIALKVASQIDSRTILDSAGAEKLLGGGDLLYISQQISKPKRIQGSYITEEEIHKVADFIRENNLIEEEAVPEESKKEEEPKGDEESSHIEDNPGVAGKTGGDIFESFLGSEGSDSEDEELCEEALQVLKQNKKMSTSLLQRHLKLGYARAARIVDLLEKKGYIGPGEGAKPRQINWDKVEG